MSTGVNEMAPWAGYLNATYPQPRPPFLYGKGMGDANCCDVYDAVTFALVYSGNCTGGCSSPSIIAAVYPQFNLSLQNGTPYLTAYSNNGAIDYTVIQFPYSTPALNSLMVVPAGTPQSQLRPAYSTLYNPPPLSPSQTLAVTPAAPGMQIGGSTAVSPVSAVSSPVATQSTATSIALPTQQPSTGISSSATCSGFSVGSTCLSSTTLLIGAALVALFVFMGKK